MRHSQTFIDLLPQVLQIAAEAGKSIMASYLSMADAKVSHKADGSPLTQVDLAAHRVIAHGLADLTPEILMVSEEDITSQAYRQSASHFWLVDPLDGTKEFLARNDEFTVNIALVQNGIAVLGVVVAPALGTAYWGATGRGAFRQSGLDVAPIHVAASRQPSDRPLRVLVSRNHLNAETQEFLRRLGPHELVQVGSSLKFCRIAEGRADIYPRLGPTCEWDTAAAQAVLEAAGGCVLRLDGMPLHYGKADALNPHFVAAADASHCMTRPP